MQAADASPSGAKGHLTYFEGVGGRAEPILFVLRLANADFEFETINLEDTQDPASDYTKRKASGEFSPLSDCGGGLPVYKENGKTYFESNAILRMLGARHGFYSTDPETMWAIDVCMEKVEQTWKHAGTAPHSHYVLAMMTKAAGGDGPTEEQTAACFAMYEEFCKWGETQLARHGKAFLAGTDAPTVADFRYIAQFSDSIYNTGQKSMMGTEMRDRVKAVIAGQPNLKKWIEETMVEVLKDVHTPDLMW